MRLHRRIVRAAICCLLPLAVASGGCGAHGIFEPATRYLTYLTNYDAANADARIVTQSMAGDTTRYSVVQDMVPASTGGFAFNGSTNDVAGVGLYDAGGSRTWFSPTAPAYPRAHCALSATSPVPGGVLLAVYFPAVGGGFARGAISLYSAGGTRLDTLVVASDTSHVSFLGLAALTDTTFIVTGRETRGAVRYPYLGLLAVTPDQRLHLRSQVVMLAQPTLTLAGVAVFAPATGSSVLHLCALVPATGQHTGLAGVSATLPDLADAMLDWYRVPVASSGPSATLSGITSLGDNVFVAGWADDTRKLPAPSTGGYWQSALAQSYTRDGTLRWSAVVKLTSHEEAFVDVAVTTDAVYAVGDAAMYWHKRSDGRWQSFGYGLVSRLDPATGAVGASFTMGPNYAYSSFETVVFANGTLTCGGLTGKRLEDGRGRAWFCRVDASGAVAPAASATAPAGARDRPAPITRGHGPARPRLPDGS